MINKKLFIIKKLRNHKIKILFIIKPIAVGERLEISAQNYQHKITNTKSNSENCARTANYYTTTTYHYKLEVEWQP